MATPEVIAEQQALVGINADYKEKFGFHDPETGYALTADQAAQCDVRVLVSAPDGSQVEAGTVLVRQRGTVYRAGDNVGTGTDYTLFAKAPGRVQYRKKGVEQHTFVSVVTE